jgi:site-specific recombinase XerD
MAIGNIAGDDTDSDDADAGLYGLVPSWTLQMNAERRLAENTVELYLLGVKSLRDWCADSDRPFDLGRDTVLHYMIERGRPKGNLQPSTLASYLKGIKAFAKWCIAEGEITRNEVAGIRDPTSDEVILPSVSPEQWTALIATCERNTFRGLRDRAIFGLLRDTGARASELTKIMLDELNVHDQTVLLHGKGGRDRRVAFSKRTAVDVDRYIRERRKSKYAAGSRNLLLSVSGPALSYWGLRNMILRRAGLAELPDITPHWFRRMFASEALDHDMHPSDLKAAGGWRSYTMVEHYTREHANRRSLDAQKAVFERRDERR